MYSLVISLLVVALSLYFLYDHRVLLQKTDAYFYRVFGRGANVVKSLFLLVLLVLVGGSLYIIYEWIANPTYTPTTYQSEAEAALAEAEKGSDYLGDQVKNLLLDFNAGVNAAAGSRALDLLQPSVQTHDGLCQRPSGSCHTALKDSKKVTFCGDKYVGVPQHINHAWGASVNLGDF